MPISGFETLEQILGVLAGLQSERPRNEHHARAIAEQRKVFEVERDRFLAEETERIDREHKARLRAARRGAGLA